MSSGLICEKCRKYIVEDPSEHHCHCGDKALMNTERECKCSMRIKLVGDGCDICNPEYWTDQLNEREVDVNTEREEFEKIYKCPHNIQFHERGNYYSALEPYVWGGDRASSDMNRQWEAWQVARKPQAAIIAERDAELEGNANRIDDLQDEVRELDRLNDEYAMIIYGSTEQSENLHKQKTDRIKQLESKLASGVIVPPNVYKAACDCINASPYDYDKLIPEVEQFLKASEVT